MTFASLEKLNKLNSLNHQKQKITKEPETPWFCRITYKTI